MANTQPLQILPIGGIEQVTQNMYLFMYQNEILIVDCGIGFPDMQMPGADIVIPDISYLKRLVTNGQKIVGMILTHGHDDHIAALPYLLPQLPEFPIYASRLTAGFAANRLLDGGNYTPVHAIPDRQELAIGQFFSVTPLAVTHSVPDTKHFLIKTPVGNLYHGTDFKLDDTPVDGILPDYEFMDEIGQQDVRLMLSDCLGVEVSHRCGSESSVGPVILKYMQNFSGKVIVTLMSSHIHRIKQVMDAAAATGRKVALVGRSVEQNVLTAAELGFITDDHDVIISKKDIKEYPDDKLVLIVAGSQGQEGSSLTRAIYGDLREVHITPRDRVLFSADAIPGNELTYYGAVDQLLIHGVDTIYPAVDEGLHQSGHAKRPEMIDLARRIKPRKILPIGGNNRHRVKYQQLVAPEIGLKPEDILLPAEGDIISLFPDGHTQTSGNVGLRPQIVDGLGVGDVGPKVFSDRRVLGQAGILIIIIKHYKNRQAAKAAGIVTNKQGLSFADMTVISRGFVFTDEGKSNEVIAYVKKRVSELLTLHMHADNKEECERQVEQDLSKSLYKIIQREPMIEVEIVEC
ncbi:ribonuclease J [bacterium]|nr:ribonuclease J [bacterium]